MPHLIEQPTLIQAAGTKPKKIEEFIGRVNSATADISVARMVSPQGWEEPPQQPEFDEYTVVLKGMLMVEHRDGKIPVGAGQAVICEKGEWVRYSTPFEGGADYIAVCLPAYSAEMVHR